MKTERKEDMENLTIAVLAVVIAVLAICLAALTVCYIRLKQKFVDDSLPRYLRRVR